MCLPQWQMFTYMQMNCLLSLLSWRIYSGKLLTWNYTTINQSTLLALLLLSSCCLCLNWSKLWKFYRLFYHSFVSWYLVVTRIKLRSRYPVYTIHVQMSVLSQEIYLFHYSIIYIVELEAANKIKHHNVQSVPKSNRKIVET